VRHRDPLWVDVPIRLQPPATLEARTLGSPTWLAGFDPARASSCSRPSRGPGGDPGLGMARCVVAADGALTDCSAMPGVPDGLGFSEAAVKLASAMKMNPWTADGAPVDGAVIRLPIRLNLAQKK